jgi:hypothetical protein
MKEDMLNSQSTNDSADSIEAPKSKRQPRKTKSKSDDPGFIRIDMSQQTPINGPSLVLFRTVR